MRKKSKRIAAAKTWKFLKDLRKQIGPGSNFSVPDNRPLRPLAGVLLGLPKVKR
jgi:hypothetical protein